MYSVTRLWQDTSFTNMYTLTFCVCFKLAVADASLSHYMVVPMLCVHMLLHCTPCMCNYEHLLIK